MAFSCFSRPNARTSSPTLPPRSEVVLEADSRAANSMVSLTVNEPSKMERIKLRARYASQEDIPIKASSCSTYVLRLFRVAESNLRPSMRTSPDTVADAAAGR